MKKETREYLTNIHKVNNNILSPEHFHSIFSKKQLTFSQRAADAITKFGGSWAFIHIFFLFFIFWILINTYFLVQVSNNNPFDPYPFILLNLILSTLAAIQAPIILMSQNRESERDRIYMHYDYAVNRKAEKEIREIKNDLLKIKRKLSIN